MENIICGGIAFDNRHIVVKRDDICLALDSDELQQFSILLLKVRAHRRAEGKDDDPTYFVVNTDEAWAQDVAEIIQYHIKQEGEQRNE